MPGNLNNLPAQQTARDTLVNVLLIKKMGLSHSKQKNGADPISPCLFAPSPVSTLLEPLRVKKSDRNELHLLSGLQPIWHGTISCCWVQNNQLQPALEGCSPSSLLSGCSSSPFPLLPRVILGDHRLFTAQMFYSSAE